MNSSEEIRALNLDVFHMRNFRYETKLTTFVFFHGWDSLKTLYMVHPDEYESVFPPKELKKLVIYCSKSSKDVIDKHRGSYLGLRIGVAKCHALKEM